MNKKYVAAIDLGTTTVEMSLLREDGTVAAKHGFANPQKKFGSDVISRLTYLDRNPGSKELRSCLLSEIRETLAKMLSWQKALYPADLLKIIVTGNTTMTAILCSLPTEFLGTAPFEMPTTHTEQFLLDRVPVVVPVGASAFLGSDICGGAWGIPLEDGEMLVDLGTNGEMILFTDGKLHGASAACGPAFENCTRSQGIYGSTTISVIANLLRTGKIPGDGTLPEEVAEKGIEFQGIRVTAKILHDVMLASAAIYATFLSLLKQADFPVEKVMKLYLAGGFGFHLSLRDAVSIGLLPEVLRDRVKIAGNTSLLAAERMAEVGIGGYDAYRWHVETHRFAGDPEYEKLFCSAMELKNR